MIREEDIISIGKFQKTHALKGELNMISEIDSEYFLEGNPCIVKYDGILVPFYIETIRPKGSESYLVKLLGVDSVEEATQFINKELYIFKHDAEEWLGEELMDTNTLIGYEIIDNLTNKNIGRIERIEDSTANLLFILKDKEDKEIYVPANDDFITNIDEDSKVIKMILPEGLIELN